MESQFPSKAAEAAIKKLRDVYSLRLTSSSPSVGRFDNYPKKILRANGRQGADIKLASLVFKDTSIGKNLNIDLHYDITNGNFYVKSAPGRIFTDSDGDEYTILNSVFYGKRRDDDGNLLSYVHRKTNEVISEEHFKSLPPLENEAIETYARAPICEVFRDYLAASSYKLDGKAIDNMPETTRTRMYTITYSPLELDAIAADINAFVLGKRGFQAKKSAVESIIVQPLEENEDVAI
jgi:hypothetical protein